MYSRLNSWAIFILVIACGLVQASAFDYINALGAKPDLLFIIMVFFSLFSDRKDAITAALWAGLVEDVTSSSVFGGYTVSFFLTALILNCNRAKFYKERISMQVLITAVFYIFMCILVLSFNSVAYKAPLQYQAFMAIMLKGAIYTAVVSPAVFKGTDLFVKILIDKACPP